MAFPLLYKLLFALLLFVSSAYVLAQTSTNINVGASLSASQTASSWLSPSGDFAFGFRQLEERKDLFLLAIWYNKIPDKTIVWYADGDKPAPTGSKVELKTDIGLFLTDPSGSEIWKSENMVSGAVSYGTMNDTGNFVIWDSSSVMLWQSFNNPRDTILPNQSLDKTMVVFSRKSETNFSRGRFSLRLQDDGGLILYTINLPTDSANGAYYRSGTSNTSPVTELQFNESGYLYILGEDGERLSLTNSAPLSARDFYHRVTLTFDGVLTHFYHPKSATGNGSWISFWYRPNNICLTGAVLRGSGTCGFNSICSLNGDGRPTCECPRGYSLLDPDDPNGSCKPNHTPSCDDDASSDRKMENVYELVQIGKTDWPLSDYALLTPFSEEECRQSCLSDCMCAVAIFREGTDCWKKKLPLSNGRYDTNFNGKALLKVLKGNMEPRSPNYVPTPNVDTRKPKNRDGIIIAGSVLLSFSAFVNVILIAAMSLGFFFIYRKKRRQILASQGNNLRVFSYKELLDATDGFKEELGRGTFAIVYKGVIRLGSDVLVAVKKLNSVIADGAREFKTELNVIGQTHHKNLVRLLGFCDTEQQNLLVYEFMSNGNLSSFLFGELKPSWNQRTQIAVGIARGLLYLHEECSTQIIHCDIKPQNILLDEYYNAKISDFGLSKLLLLDQSQTLTTIRGTKGYIAPEWFRNVPITPKVDIYSFGVLLLEIICCRKNVASNECATDPTTILTDWAYDCFIDRMLHVLVEHDTGALNDLAKVERFVKIAVWCIQEDPSIRPTMRRVTQMLDGVVEVPAPPSLYSSSATN